ncbi:MULTISPECIES: hypothetical protein [Nonlabens]|uniref:Uncharacterized protein n=1 Tax=Nonlabens ulvanivorans TaxID=906888 RepID=A0A081DG79_NONUL|nr:hypothetical protein [Nonlabens ulvanivorans]GAK77925.1 hypothetical protein JCM19296_3534 [Nonlabens ulvanivorans]
MIESIIGNCLDYRYTLRFRESENNKHHTQIIRSKKGYDFIKKYCTFANPNRE